MFNSLIEAHRFMHKQDYLHFNTTQTQIKKISESLKTSLKKLLFFFKKSENVERKKKIT